MQTIVANIKKRIVRGGPFTGLLKSFFIVCGLLLYFNSHAQVISNNGAAITATAGVVLGTRDLTNAAGQVTNNGTVNMSGDFTSTGTTDGNGAYNLAGNWTNIGTFNPGTSTVTFNGNQTQNLTSPGGEKFHNLVLTNTGVAPSNNLNLNDDAEAAGILTLASGNVTTGANKLYLSNSAVASLNYTSLTESRVIGKFERGVNTTASYFYPLGSLANFNPLNLTPNSIQSAGSALSEFVPQDPGNNGLPIPDNLVEVWETYRDGYWGMTARNGFSSSDYDLNVDAKGFTEPVFSYTRVIKKPVEGTWTVDGVHRDAVGTVAYRDHLSGNISPGGHLFALAKIRPRVLFHPEDTAICDGADAYFRVVATGYLPLTYRWQVWDDVGGNWLSISDDLVYSGTAADTVFLTAVPRVPFDGNRYRVVIKDTYLNSKDSDSARLTVDPIPYIINTILADTICNNTGFEIELQSDVQGSTFDWNIFPDLHISGGAPGSLPLISQTLGNSHHSVENIIYRVVPTGPGTTFCVGPSTDFTIRVNPTPTLTASLAGLPVVCDTASININYVTGNPSIIGEHYYQLVTSNTGSVSGINPSGNSPISTSINDVLINNTRHLQSIQYQAIPYFRNVSSRINECRNGIDTVMTIQLNPTPVFDSIVVSDTVICNESFVRFRMYNTQITSGTVVYDLEGTYSGTVAGVKPDGQYGIAHYTDTLVNSSALIQPVTYLFKPAINDPVNGLYCNKGITSTRVVKVNPTLTTASSSFQYIGGRNIRCFGENNGDITLTPSGGYYLQPWIYEYTKGGSPVGTNSAHINGLNAGTYDYTVRDVIGCSTSGTITLTQPALLTIADSIKETSCAGFSDGRIYADIAGGTSGYNWRWRGPENFGVPPNPLVTNPDSIIDLRPGIYYLRIQDQNICEAYDTIFLLARPEVSIGTASRSNYGGYDISCFGLSDGWVNLNVSGNGTLPSFKKFAWLDVIGDTISFTKDIANIEAGYYTIFVKDSIGCEATRDYLFVEPQPMVISRTGQKYPGGDDISCYGLADGIINLAITGSHSDKPGMVYSWTKTGDPGYTAGTRDINGLTAGTYQIEARDMFNCPGSAVYVLTEPTDIIVSASDTSDYNGYNVSCHSGDNGWINVDVAGGYGEYSYNWTTGDGIVGNPSLKDQSGLIAGTYTLRATDKYNCFREWNFTLDEPDTVDILPQISQYNGYEIDCNGALSGFINLNTLGGVQPYSFQWNSTDGSGLIATNENQSGLSAGNYQVDIRDLNNCLSQWNFSLNEPGLLTSSNIPKTVSCFGINDGNINLSVDGGVEPYVYLWSHGKTTQDVDSLYMGWYFVDIRDLNNCHIRDSADITEPPKILVDLTSSPKYNGLMISCFGRSDADLTAQVTGGFGAYRYNWLPNGETSRDLNNIPAGTYTLTVTDDNNCVEADTFTVTEPAPITTEVYPSDPGCFEGTDGEINLIPLGGNTAYPYEIVWSDGQTGQVARNLAAGNYSVVIRDVNLCEIDTNAVLSEPEPLKILSLSSPAYCPDRTDGSISVEVEGGTAPYDLDWEEGYQGELLQDLGIGEYVLKVTDFNQCIRYDTIEVESANKDCLRIPTAFTPNGDGFNDTWQIEWIHLYPEVVIEIYNRWGDLVFRSDKGYSKEWDGTYKGRELPIDSYHFVIIRGGTRKPITGNVTIIR